jgi:hypothetical protein
VRINHDILGAVARQSLRKDYDAPQHSFDIAVHHRHMAAIEALGSVNRR